MTKTVVRVLLIEDNPADALFVQEALEQDALATFALTVAEDLREGLALVQEQAFNVLLLDLGLPDSQGLATFDQIHRRAPALPVVVLSGMLDEQFAIDSVHVGAQDYLVKGPAGWSMLARAIRYAIERQRSAARLTALHAIDRAILLADSLTVIADTVLAHLRRLIPCQHARVLLYEPGTTIGLLLAVNADVLPVTPAGSQVTLNAIQQSAAFQQGQPYLAADLQATEQLGQSVDAASAQTALLVPLIVRDTLLGSLDVLATTPGALTDEHVVIMHEVGDMLAIAIYNNQLLVREQRARQVAELLQRASELLARSLGLDEIQDMLLSVLQQLIPYDSATIMLRSGETQLAVQYARGYEQWTDAATTRKIAFDITQNRLIAEVVASQHGLIVPDVTLIQDWERVPGAEHVRCWLAVPLIANNAVLGIFSIDHHLPNVFTAEHMRLAETLAATAATALVRARLFVQIQQELAERTHAEQLLSAERALLEARVVERTAEFARANAALQAEIAGRIPLERQIQQHATQSLALADISRALTEAGHEPQALYETIVHHVARLIGDASGLIILSDGRQSMDLVAVGHAKPERSASLRALIPNTISVSNGLVGQAVLSGQPLIIPVVSPDQIRAQIGAAFLPYLDSFGMSSLLIVPLRVRDRLLGTLGVARDQFGLPYTQEDQAFLQDLADRAGLAIENARLFAAAEQARAEAERANHAKSAFLSSMSHELRTPLNAILGFTGTLLMRLPGPLTVDQERQLTTVQRSGNHLLALINDLLDLAKIESGSVEIYLEPVICQNLLAEVVESLRPLAEQKGLQLRNVIPTAPVVVTSDARALSQILINLLNNAIKFTDTGAVTISLQQTTNDPADAPLAVRPSSFITFTVHDTGIGIRSEDLATLFTEFGRANSDAVRAREGTGIGLRLSRQLAALLGGRIELASAFGIGSTFTLVLPDR